MTCNPDRPLRALFGVAGLAMVGAALAWTQPARADAADARVAIAQALGQFERGHWTAARDRAQAATAADPDWGFAQAVLARIHLALGEGAAAEGAIDRAIRGGFDAARAHQLRAHARLLQGDTSGAIAEADRAAPRYRGYAVRIKAQALAAQGDVAAALPLFDRVLTDRPGDAGAWSALGRVRMTAGDMAGAINAAAMAVRADPASPDALELRAETVRAQYGLVAALPWFEAALRRDPRHHDTLIEYAATLGDAGRNVAMLTAVRRAMAVRPESAQGYYLQAVLAARAGDMATARSVLQRAGDRLSGVPAALLLSASIDLGEGAHAQAAATLRTLVARQPTNVTARKLLALALLRGDAARDALAFILPAAQRDDADSYTLTLTARALERIGDRAGAATMLDRAASPARGRSTAFAPDAAIGELAARASTTPGDPAVAVPYIRALLTTGDLAQATRAAQIVADANPGAPAAQLVLGDTLAAGGRFAAAATAYARAAATRFDEPTMLRLVDARNRAGQRRDASTALSLFLGQNPNNATALRLAGQWQLAAGDAAAAVDTLETLRTMVGDRDAALLADLSAAYAMAGQSGPAVDYAAAAYALAPANPLVVDAYSRALVRAGNAGAALPLAVKAVRLAPGHAGIRLHLAEITGG